MFSNQDSITSQSNSDKFAESTINVVGTITGNDYSESQKNDIVIKSRFLIRKTAHFILYFILGIFVYITFNSYGLTNRIVFYSILFAFIYSTSDEFHQLFSDGRTFKILDISIDIIGASLGASFAYLIKRKSRKNLIFY